MSDNTSDLTNLPLTESTQSMQTAIDLMSNLSAPFRKLDADEYNAHDLDGVTEGLTGSGNLNFLMMQAGQTNEAMSNSNPFNVEGGSDLFQPSALLAPALSSTALLITENQHDTAMDRGFDKFHDLDAPIGGNAHNNNTNGSLGASNLASNSQELHPLASTASTSEVSTSTSGSPTNGTSGNNGTSGTNGTDGTNGDGHHTTIIDIDNSIHTGDTTTNLIDDSILTTIHNVYHDTTNLLTDITNNTTDFLSTVVNDVTNIVNNIIDNNPLDLGPIGVSLDATLDDLTHLNLDVISGDNIINVVDQIVDLSPILTPAQSVLGDVLSHVSLDAIVNPFHYDNSPTDYDIHVGAGLDILGLSVPGLALDIPLDPVEGLVGDIDVGLNVNDILGGLPVLGGGGNGDTDLSLGGLEHVIDPGMLNGIAQTIINPVEDLVGDIDIGGGINISLLGLGNDLDAGGTDTDITIPLDIALVDHSLLSSGIDIPLDPIESFTGDIDLNLGAGANILGDVATGLIDSQEGGSGSNGLLSNVGDIVSDDAGSLLAVAMPDPTDLSIDIDFIDTNSLQDIVGDLPDVSSLTDPSPLTDTVTNLLENMLDTIDNTLNNAIDLLDSTPINTGGLDLGALSGDLTGGDMGSTLTTWTDTILPDAGSVLGDGLVSDITSIIPDPILNTPIIPLPVIPVVTTPVTGGALGGLLGGGGSHHGGLFG